MKSGLGRLLVVIGLPGAGKSSLIDHRLRQTVTGLCVHDFHADAVDNSPAVRKSRHFSALVEAMKAGHACIIADIEFCRSCRREEVERNLRVELPLLEFEYHCFKNQPGRCVENVRARNRSSADEECRKIEELSKHYVLPSGAVEYDVQTMAFPSQSQLDDIVGRGLEKLFREDGPLLAADANERSISHRLAIYIEELLPTWDVDCEYNRSHHDPKTTMLRVESTTNDDEHASTVFPDIIVHHRDTDDNLLVIEMKKSSSRISSEQDRQKIESYRRPPLCYRHAMFLKIRTDDRQTQPWIIEWQR